MEQEKDWEKAKAERREKQKEMKEKEERKEKKRWRTGQKKDKNYIRKSRRIH